MSSHSLFQLSDPILLRFTRGLLGELRERTSEFLAHLAEVDARQLHRGVGYSSLNSFCVGEWHMTRDAAFKWIAAARAGREHPTLLAAIASGQLSLTGAVLLAPHLDVSSAEELLVAAAHRTCAEIRAMLADRACAAWTPAVATGAEHSTSDNLLDSNPVIFTEPGHRASDPTTGVACAAGAEALGPRASIRIAVPAPVHEKLAYARALLGHAIPDGDAGAVLERCFDLAIAHLEKAKFGAGSRTRAARAPGGSSMRAARASADPRHIPAAVRRAVFERDGGRCTFVGSTGHRCDSRTRLEFDHVVPVARGGRSSAENLQLRCRAHNQFAAEQAFGAGFMQAKRDAARARKADAKASRVAERGAAAARPRQRAATEPALARDSAERDAERPAATLAAAPAAAARAAELAAAAARRAAVEEVVPALRNLGCTLAEAREAAAICATIPDAPIEERLRLVLRSRVPRGTRTVVSVAAGSA